MQELTQLKESPSQTAGPYVHIGCVPNFCDITGVYPEDLGAHMVNAETKGERITVKGTIYDGTQSSAYSANNSAIFFWLLIDHDPDHRQLRFVHLQPGPAIG